MTLQKFLTNMAGGWGFSNSMWIERFGEKLRKLKWENVDVEVSVDFNHYVEGGHRIYLWRIKGAELPKNALSKFPSFKTFEVKKEDEGFSITYRPGSHSRK